MLSIPHKKNAREGQSEMFLGWKSAKEKTVSVTITLFNADPRASAFHDPTTPHKPPVSESVSLLRRTLLTPSPRPPFLSVKQLVKFLRLLRLAEAVRRTPPRTPSCVTPQQKIPSLYQTSRGCLLSLFCLASAIVAEEAADSWF